VDTNLDGKIAAAVEELRERDFVLLNIKGSDEAAHDGNAKEKKQFIERIDTSLAPLFGLSDCLLVICGDHSTPCTLRDHSADPVPLLIRGDGVRVDGVKRFDEISCAQGGLHRLVGLSLMPIILDLINKTHKYGA
jgi:2,3-bisphosphoglycerate-independent phosphoglycerate mutase